jgi:hypothetical protein
LTVLVALVVLAIPVVGAGVGLLYWQGVRAPADGAEYVALGSSFAAGPGVGERAPDSPALCIRSATNYPHLVAQARQLDLTDVTCSGATALNVLDGGQFFQPPQVDALKFTTQLVTVTVGDNDVDYLGNLFGWSCQHDPAAVPFLWRRAGVCTVTSDAEVDTELAALPARLDQIAQQVRQRSPHAHLVFVDYTTVLPHSGSCPARLAPMLSFNVRASSPPGWSQKLPRPHNATVHCSPRCPRPLTATTSARPTPGSSASHSQAVPFSTDRSPATPRRRLCR